MLLGAWIKGTDPRMLSEFTGYPEQFILEISIRMREAELWTGETADCEHWFEEERFEAAIFWTDVLVAEGRVVRGLEDGVYRYWARPHAPAHLAGRKRAVH